MPLRFQTTAMRVGATSQISLPIEAEEPSELHICWNTLAPEGGTLDFVADFAHVNGETVLMESQSAAMDTRVELHGEGEVTLVWENKNKFAARSLAYTLTLTTKRELAEAMAQEESERKRGAQRDAQIVELGADLAFKRRDADESRQRQREQTAAVAALREQLALAEARLDAQTAATEDAEHAANDLVEQVAALEAERASPLLPSSSMAAETVARQLVDHLSRNEVEAAIALCEGDADSSVPVRGWDPGEWEFLGTTGPAAIVRAARRSASAASSQEFVVLAATSGRPRLLAGPLSSSLEKQA